MKKLLITIILLFFVNNIFATTICDGKPVIGSIEKIKLMGNAIVDAKIDTGAAMSSLSATDISSFQQNNQLWVRFTILNPITQQKTTFDAPFIRYVQIKKRKDEHDLATTSRPVVNMTVCIGKEQQTILVNLTDRTEFDYPMLIGRDALQKFKALVDVSQKYLLVPACK